MQHLLGIDPGGTKCAALLVAPDGTALKWNCHTGNGVTGRHITAISSACKPLVDGHTGPLHMVSTGENHAAESNITNVLENETDFIPVTEWNAALALADEDHGIILLAGTGAFTELVPKDGKEKLLDGKGPLIGDFGGGFWIGQNALRAMTRNAMHKRHATSLAAIIQSKFTKEEFWRIAVFDVNPHDRMTVASLAKVVNSEAEAGDKISMEILFSAAHELAETVFDALDANNLLESDYTLTGTGSVICCSSILWNRLVENIKVFAPNLRFKRLTEHPAVVGVALAGAKTLMENEEYRKYRKRLMESFTKIATPAKGTTDDTSYISQ